MDLGLKNMSFIDICVISFSFLGIRLGFLALVLATVDWVLGAEGFLRMKLLKHDFSAVPLLPLAVLALGAILT